MGLVALAGIFVYFLIVSSMEKKSATIALNAQDALEFNRKSNLDMEKLMTPYTIFQELVASDCGDCHNVRIDFLLGKRHDVYCQCADVHCDVLPCVRADQIVWHGNVHAAPCLCNLIARFWDVDSGSVKIGGQEGIYADFVLGRKEAIGWKLQAQ